MLVVAVILSGTWSRPTKKSRRRMNSDHMLCLIICCVDQERDASLSEYEGRAVDWKEIWAIKYERKKQNTKLHK